MGSRCGNPTRLEERAEIYNYGFLFANLADLAEANPEYIQTRKSLVDKGREFVNGINPDELELYLFFRNNAFHNRKIDPNEFFEVKRTINRAFDELSSSPTARKLIVEVFENLSDAKMRELEEIPL